mgnify:CR=1 FL=1
MHHPPFCPNPQCVNHRYVLKENKYNWFAKDGFYSTKVYGKIQRYKCKHCKIRFSKQSFSIDYYAKKKVNYKNLMKELVSTSNISDISRRFKVSHNTVLNKIRRLSRQAIASNSILRQYVAIPEPFVSDGFESVAVNYYYPNNINILVGKNSLFYYQFNYSSIKRTGILSDQQKKMRNHYESIWKANTKSVEFAFNDLLLELLQMQLSLRDRFPITLITDKKLEYTRAIHNNSWLFSLHSSRMLQHLKISSKEPRTLDNPLFPVNYMDRQFRKDLAEHVSKSVCFGKNVNNQMERMYIYQFYHNYLKKFRVRDKNFRTHSQITGIPDSLRKKHLEMLFRDRFFITRLNLTDSEYDCWNRNYETPLKVSKEYLPHYLGNLPCELYEEWCA